jgi:molybdopterin synthase catalytic subunit
MDFAELTTSPINIAEVARRVIPPDCGATVTLDGYPRKFTKQHDGSTKETEYLVYEAYEPMAVKEMDKLIAAAKGQFDISHVGIVHRTGRLEIGETSVVISVAAPHRRVAFEACEWLIKELKRTVPIWKKEVYLGGEEWIEGAS